MSLQAAGASVGKSWLAVSLPVLRSNALSDDCRRSWRARMLGLLQAHTTPRASSANTPNRKVRPFSASGLTHALGGPAACRRAVDRAVGAAVVEVAGAIRGDALRVHSAAGDGRIARPGRGLRGGASRRRPVRPSTSPFFSPPMRRIPFSPLPFTSHAEPAKVAPSLFEQAEGNCDDLADGRAVWRSRHCCWRWLVACLSRRPRSPPRPRPRSTARPCAASMPPAQVGDWMSYGRGWDEQRYSPLDQINDSNVRPARPGLVSTTSTPSAACRRPRWWSTGCSTTSRIYNIVTAYDARTGAQAVDLRSQGRCRMGAGSPAAARSARGARGVERQDLHRRARRPADRDRREDRPAKCGPRRPFDDPADAPIRSPARRASIDGKVVIGNGGADYGVRGFVVAYDAETGKQMWKFYTVPGDPAHGPDGEATDSAMQIALPTWHGEWWKYGGGGTAWDRLRLRSRAQPGLHRHRQRLARTCEHFRSDGKRRQPVPVLDRRGRCRPPASTSGTTRWSPRKSGTTPAPSR